MKRSFRKSSVILIVSLIIYFYIIKWGIIDISILDSNHFNLITVNSVFAGFLFSALALIVSISSDKVLLRLERANFLESIYTNIVLGITNSVISIALSVFNLFVSPSIINKLIAQPLIFTEFFKYCLPGLELFFLILAIITFMMAVRDVKFIIRSVRKRIRSEFPDKETVQKTLDLIK